MSYKEFSGKYLSEKIKGGTLYQYRIYVPQCSEQKNSEDSCSKDLCSEHSSSKHKSFALIVTHDGLNEAEANAVYKLAESGEAPYSIIVGISAGSMYPPDSEGYPRYMRFNDYDMFDSAYVDFIIDEFIPYIKEKYSLDISDDPNMHMISGGSSGGISAWNGVWFRNDYFRRAYLSSPTFSAMARGNIAPVQIRLFETKPIRVYIDYSENEPDDYFGSSYCAALEGRYALEFAGYDYKWNYYPGEGHCSRLYDEASAEDVMRFIWKDWKTEPIKPKRLSNRAETVIYADHPWEKTSKPVPVKTILTKYGEYKISKSSIILISDGKERIVADGFSALSAIAVSSDLWRLYIADSSRGCIYAAVISENGDLKNLKKIASLQLPTDFSSPGAFDICVDRNDRIYAATELGIQCIRTFGLVDLIIPLPEDKIPDSVSLSENFLYTECKGEIFRRKIKSSAKEDMLKAEEPKFTEYYD